MSEEQLIDSDPVSLPYYVVDAFLERGLRSLPVPISIRRESLSSGSVRYHLSGRNNRTFGYFEIAAVSADTTIFETYITVPPGRKDYETVRTVLNTLVTAYKEVFKKGSLQAIRISAMMADLVDHIKGTEEAPERPGLKRGPRPLKINEWARQEAAAGKTIDDILPEYARRRKMNPVEARELLRKALSRND